MRAFCTFTSLIRLVVVASKVNVHNNMNTSESQEQQEVFCRGSFIIYLSSIISDLHDEHEKFAGKWEKSVGC